MRITDFTHLISVLDINTYANKQFIFFYDALTELTKHHIIYRIVNDDFAEDQNFKSNEETVEEKTKLFETMNNE